MMSFERHFAGLIRLVARSPRFGRRRVPVDASILDHCCRALLSHFVGAADAGLCVLQGRLKWS